MKKLVSLFALLPLWMLTGWNQSLPVVEIEITNWEYRMVGDSVWKKATVPGTIIHNLTDLTDLSNPMHPYQGDNEKLYQWVADQDWEFRTTYTVDDSLLRGIGWFGGRFDLVFGSLDLFAEVYVNDQKYIHENAFYPLVIKDMYATSVLDIKVVLHSTTRRVGELADKNKVQLPGGNRVYARKAQFEFGWDWGPTFINMGIRKPVKLVIRRAPAVTLECQVASTRCDKNIALMELGCTISGEDHFNLYMEIRKQGKIISRDSTRHYNKHSVTRSITLYQPDLWWPNGYGTPHVYEIDMWVTDLYDTIPIARKKFNYAFCNIELVQEKDKKGESFYFKVNGEKIFAKGANYIPGDSFEPEKNSTELISLAANANMNMIRVWGGGNYLDDDFYEECMRQGIIVWQDNMFACAMYPFDDDFIYNASIEAEYQYLRLRNYRNIAVWCGNNECEEGWQNWGWQKELKYNAQDSAAIWEGYEQLFKNRLWFDTVPDYISTSPKHGWGRKESMTEGDAHYWGVWWGLEPIEKYNEKVPRFMSEFGMQAMPALSTLKKVIPDSAMNFNSPQFKNHQKHPTGFQTLDHYLKAYLVIPDNMEDYAYATQVLQSYALTTAIEAQRRAMPYCMGSLIWQLNDCWPVTSWSLVDYELTPKMAYHDVWKSFGKVILSVEENSNSFDIYIINEGKHDENFELRVEINDFYRNPIWSKQKVVRSKKRTSTKVHSISKKCIAGIDLSTVYLYCSIKTAEHVLVRPLITETCFHFLPPNQLKLPPADFKIVEDNDQVYLESKVYTPYLLLPGETKTGQNYWGNTQPGKYNLGMGYNGSVDYLKHHLDEIKCLNQLLKK